MTTAAALGSAGAIPAAPKDSRLRIRILFAVAFGTLVLFESYIGFHNVVSPDLRLHYLGRAMYWTAADGALWWICVCVADRACGDGIPRAVPYVLAAVAASVAAPFVHWATSTWYFEPPLPGRNPMPPILVWWMVSIVGAWRLTLLTAAYYYRLRTLADAAHVARTRLDRAVLSRKAIESQLRALQGKVDPNLLFETLDDIEQACEWDPARADRMLECLIAFLRSALPHTEDDRNTVGQEIALAGAYLALAEARSEGFTYAIDASEEAREAVLAPMLLTPLVGHAFRGVRETGGRVTIECALDASRLRIVVAARGAAANAVWQRSSEVAEIDKRLQDVYGGAATLGVGAAGTDNLRMVLQVPHEPSPRGHR